MKNPIERLNTLEAMCKSNDVVARRDAVELLGDFDIKEVGPDHHGRAAHLLIELIKSDDDNEVILSALAALEYIEGLSYESLEAIERLRIAPDEELQLAYFASLRTHNRLIRELAQTDAAEWKEEAISPSLSLADRKRSFFDKIEEVLEDRLRGVDEKVTLIVDNIPSILSPIADQIAFMMELFSEMGKMMGSRPTQEAVLSLRLSSSSPVASAKKVHHLGGEDFFLAYEASADLESHVLNIQFSHTDWPSQDLELAQTRFAVLARLKKSGRTVVFAGRDVAPTIHGDSVALLFPNDEIVFSSADKLEIETYLVVYQVAYQDVEDLAD